MTGHNDIFLLWSFGSLKCKNFTFWDSLGSVALMFLPCDLLSFRLAIIYEHNAALEHSSRSSFFSPNQFGLYVEKPRYRQGSLLKCYVIFRLSITPSLLGQKNWLRSTLLSFSWWHSLVAGLFWRETLFVSVSAKKLQASWTISWIP